MTLIALHTVIHYKDTWCYCVVHKVGVLYYTTHAHSTFEVAESDAVYMTGNEATLGADYV